MGTATLIEKNLADFTGRARLYKVDPPVEYNGETSDYVVVSAVIAYSGPETYIFPADEKGNVVSWNELDGSYRGGLDHEEALRDAGYDV